MTKVVIIIELVEHVGDELGLIGPSDKMQYGSGLNPLMNLSISAHFTCILVISDYLNSNSSLFMFSNLSEPV
jgi:hypothetical protein